MTDAFDPYYTWLGIPPAEQPPNHYRLLGISLFEDDPDVVANAADRQMLALRTYQYGNRAELSQKLLNEVAKARVCLLSETKRAAYDDQLRKELARTAPTPPLAEPPKPASPPPAPQDADSRGSGDILVSTDSDSGRSLAAPSRPNRAPRLTLYALSVCLLVASAAALYYFFGGSPAGAEIVRQTVKLAPQSASVGQPLAFSVEVDEEPGEPGARQFRLGPGAPAGAILDASTGEFSWTPDEPGQVQLLLCVENREARWSLEGNMVVDVREEDETQEDAATDDSSLGRPRLLPVPDQTVTAGHMIMRPVRVDRPELMAGQYEFGLGPSSPSWIQIDATTGMLTIDPPANLTPGDYPVTVCLNSLEAGGRVELAPFRLSVTASSR